MMAEVAKDDLLFQDAKAVTDTYVAEQLISRPEWGAYDFSEVAAEFRIILRYCQDIALLDERMLTEGVRNDLRSHVLAGREAMSDVAKFNLKDPPNIKEQHAHLVGRVKESGHNVALRGLPLLHGLPRSATPPMEDVPDAARSALLETLDKAHMAAAAAEAAKEMAQSVLKEAQAASLAIKESSARTGVSVHEKDFSEEVKALEKGRVGWLVASGLLLIVTIIAAFKLTDLLPPADNYLLFAQHIVTKIFVVGALGAATVWCGYNFRVLSHQLTVNRHRMNALRTFKTFIAAAETPEIRQTILLETTRTIFGPTATGFLPTGTDVNLEGSAKLAETLAKVGKSGTPS